jgi:hypothetical protein
MKNSITIAALNLNCLQMIKNKVSMKQSFSSIRNIILFFVFTSLQSLNAQNSNLGNLLSTAQWDSLFPRRAGTYGVHPQGYTTDFYSFENLNQAVNEMTNYVVEIKRKAGVYGELITVTNTLEGVSYIYSDVDVSWYLSEVPILIHNVYFADFLNTNSYQRNKRELAAFLANISKETTGGWQMPIGGGSEGDYANWGLYFVHEVGYNASNGAGTYSQASSTYPPNPNVGYYGRGPIQLSWNYNYGQFSKFLFNDISVLLDNPDLVQQDGVLAFKSAIWFWMMPQCPKPSCHQVMQGMWLPELSDYSAPKMYLQGFAHTNNIINGGLECRSSSTPAFTQKVVLRSELYKHYLSILGFDESEILLEDTDGNTTLCYESANNAMEDYVNCSIGVFVNTQVNHSSNLLIYPNPVDQSVVIQQNQLIDKIEVVNIFGQIAFSAMSNSNKVEINLSDLSTGIYMIQIYSGNSIQSQRIIKS